MSRQRFLLTIALLTLALGTVLVFALSKEDNSDPVDSQDKPVSLTSVTASGLDAVLPKIQPVTQEKVQVALMGIIRMNVAQPKSKYGAEYRDGTFSTASLSGGTLQTRFLVDVPELERSFVIRIETNTAYGSNILYALCPQPSELIYKPQECKDAP